MNPTRQRYYLLLLGALTFAGCGNSSDDENSIADDQAAPVAESPVVEPSASHDLASLLAGESRPEADRARDAGRKPADVIAFLGIEPGMSVIDIIAAGGYYTEVLSLAVGPEGHVVAHNTPFILEMRDGVNEKALSERLSGNRLPNVSRLNKDVPEISPTDGTFDVAITALNFHDVYNNYGEEGAIGLLSVVAAVLKPGGVFGIIDHQGIEGNDNKALHRALKADVIRVAQAAGFVVDGDSGILHNHNDDMTQAVFAEDVRGKTNRFLLKLRKPGG